VRYRNWCEADHMPTQLCDEVSWFHWVHCRRKYTSSATDACRSGLNDVWIPRGIRRSASVHLLVCVAHDGCFQGPVEAFHEFVGCGMVAVVQES
jgi:hypothetical protein